MSNLEFGDRIQSNVTSEPRLSRFMGWIGLLALVAFVAGFGVLNGNQPSENASGISDAAWMNAHSTMRWAQIYVIAFALTLVLLFVAQLRRVLHDATDGRQVWPDLVFAAGLIFVAAELASGGVNATVFIIAAHNHDYAIAHLANFVGQNSEIAMIYGLALLTLTTGIAILSGSTLPRWIGFASVIIGIVCVLGPIGFFGTLAAAVWLPVLGFVIAKRAKLSAPISFGAGSTVAAT
jgi:magnesium-transporting ATPase (P-type)